VTKIRNTFAAIYKDMLLDLPRLKSDYLQIEEKWSNFCKEVDLTTASDKAFAKLNIELHCEGKDLTSISETDIISRYSYLLNGKIITEDVLPANKRKRSKPKVFSGANRSKKQKTLPLNEESPIISLIL